ncbi:uncharacterized protein LOC135125780 isoform X1 [Zophobas morio]|uniref:uncharacterized protein LOC135125780 isoform X1 n=1 Tax=Zophobas morio TaxID=2755281 RepID=UPI0030836AF4
MKRFLKTLFPILFLLGVSSNEIIKFEHENHILCITDDAESLIYLKPPLVTKTRNTSILIENDVIWDDWSLKSSTEVVVPAVLDKRWEDLETSYTDSFHYESVSSISFSVSGGTNLTIVISEPPPALSKAARDISIDWVHYTMPSVNENATEFVQFQINATSSEQTYFKIHDYKLRWADTVSETPTRISISHTEIPCFMLYTYVGFYCTLQVNITRESVQSFSRKSRWQYLKYEPKTDVEIKFLRETTNGDTKGQWAVDIRQCPPTVDNKTIYEISLEDDVEKGEERRCVAGTTTTKQNNIRQFPSVKINDDAFSCNPGTVGRNCDINCTNFLGSDKSYCEQHKICDDTYSVSECFCSWGYEGETCNKTCSNGKWDLSCRETCKNCDMCNAKTGQCTSSALSNFRTAGGLLLLGMIFKFL